MAALPRVDALGLQASRRRIKPSAAPVPNRQGQIEISPLLRYYRSCLAAEERVDASSAWSEIGERSVPVRLSGAWWPEGHESVTFTISRKMLPEAFQQAIARAKNSQTIHLGYPLDLFEPSPGEIMVRAVASLPLRWRVEGPDLILLEPIESTFSLNPSWLAFHRKSVDVGSLVRQIGADPSAQDEELSTPDLLDFGDLCTALNLAFAKRRTAEIDPSRIASQIEARPGLHNVAALFLISEARFSAGAIRDLAELAERPAGAFAGTALGTLLGLPPSAPTAAPAVLEPVDLTFGQLAAVRSALDKPLTVVTGPPGTGKSQVVAAMLASAAMGHCSVLFASRNHAAIDAVEQRMAELSPDRPLMLRLNQRWGEGTPIRPEKLVADLISKPARYGAWDNLRRKVESLSALDAERSTLSRQATDLARLRARIADLEDQLDQALVILGRPVETVRDLPPAPAALSGKDGLTAGFFARLLATLAWLQARLFASPEWEVAGRPSKSEPERRRRWLIALSQAQRALAEISTLIGKCPPETEQAKLGEGYADLTQRIRREAGELASALAEALDACTDAERQVLLDLRGRAARGRLSSDAVRILLRHYPVWACSNLTISRFAPLELGLFDYVVIDEASQCDIASALPLLARAKSATIVGDPAQLPFVSGLSADWETETLTQLGLADAAGIGRYRQSRNSLFDLASTVPGAERHLLTDHFRCHPSIADYFETFYGGQLSILTKEAELKPPPGSRPGLTWEDVTGPIEPARTGCHAPAEAEAILAAIEELLNQGYTGTIGVCTPFREHAKRMTDLIAARLSAAQVEKARLVAQTANGFQGDARDVILFSLCCGPGMPAGSLTFVKEGANLFNVAISRAKAVCRVFGNRSFAARCDIPHVRRLLTVCDKTAASQSERRFESPWEERLHDALRNVGIDCIPQFPVAGRRLDLAWFGPGNKRLDIEVDGDRYHRDPSGLRRVDDVWRDHQLRGLGWDVIRFWVYELRENTDACVERVQRAINS
ncbi:AAA domain-containing protein [Microvirga sp. Mcv34]|uniref:AAA domain-containing protein n=1 Tax=Microvirga sp. Mcv34 TaxID=2926016 RepID=UPI0021CA8A7B|nr:AAA domain-containing protein [Microvirga sp. Mcv34]